MKRTMTRQARNVLNRAVLLCSWLVAGVLVTPVPAAAQNGSPLVMTADGPVVGFITKGVNEFLGIPYAAPPVGDLRWMPPQPHAPWTTPLDATAFRNTCPQNQELGVFAGPPSTTEDCLFLNVFTTDLEAGSNVPVLVWIHGGGNFDGESNDYDASKLATQGQMVVVTINYRLGLLGFLAHPALDGEGHPFGNYGIMDQQLALKWVQKNIAAFGGDPHNVTLGGESAGSVDTAANVLSPLAAGLFHRAIFQSGPTNNTVAAPLGLAEARGTNFAVAAGCGSGTDSATAACLRALSVSQILSLQGSPTAPSPAPFFSLESFIVDGTVVPVSPDEAWASGQFNRMPIMNGTEEDDGAFLVMINEFLNGPLTAEQYTAIVTATWSGPAGPSGGPPNYPAGTAAAVLNEYPLSNYASPSLAWVRNVNPVLGADPAACEARHLNHLLSQWVPLYAYEFDDRSAPSYFPPVSFPTGAYHTSDIQFLFPLWHGGPLGTPHSLSTEEETLSNQLVGFWTNFARFGNPNGGAGNHTWPRYEASNPVYLSENIPALSTFLESQLSAAHKCDFWDNILIF